MVGHIITTNGSAIFDLVLATIWHFVGKFCVRVDGIVVCFDAICVVDGKFGIIFCLYRYINYSVTNQYDC